MWIIFKKYYADKYHDLKLTHELSTGNTLYHSAYDVVLNGDIDSTLDKTTMAATS